MQFIKPSYSSNSCVTLENVFTESELDEIWNLYREFYATNGKSLLDEEASLSPLTGPLEFHKGFAEIVAKKERLFQGLQEILGLGYQFLGSETINVGNDTHGPHRDYYYKHDVAKVLICINDRLPEGTITANNGRDAFQPVLDGCFLVFPGSHNIHNGGTHSSQIRTSWPAELTSQYKECTDLVHLGDERIDGSFYYPYEDAKGRYSGFEKITFKRGDVIIFSTRAIHALYPQRNSHMMHFLGLLFVEDFNQGYNKYAQTHGLIRKIYSIISLEKVREAFQYLCLPANSEIIGGMMRSKEYPPLPMAKGIQDKAIIQDPVTNSRFRRLQIIHKGYRALPTIAKKIFLSTMIAKEYAYGHIRIIINRIEKDEKILARSLAQTKRQTSFMQKAIKLCRWQ